MAWTASAYTARPCSVSSTSITRRSSADRFRRTRFLGIVRDWYPYPLMLLGYREMGWFARPRDAFPLEEAWVVWDRILLNEWGLKAAIELLGPVLPSILEIAYSLVYAIVPFCMAALYLSGRRERVDELFAGESVLP